MTRLRSRYAIAVLAVIGAVVAALAAIAAGSDVVALALGAAISAATILIVIVAWLERARRQADRAERSTRLLVINQGRRTRHAVHAAERRLFSQLEALAWLRDELDLPSPLPPTRGAAASPDLLLQLLRIIDRIEPAVILELGSGISTLVMAARCKSAGRGHVVALEHDAKYAAATRHELRSQGLTGLATVVDAPLVDSDIAGKSWPWYELGPGVPDRIELLLVDGPPRRVGHLARYPALPLLRDRLAPRATIIADDGDRPDEREMVQRWQSEVEGLEARHLPFAKGAWLVTMPG